MTDRLYESDGYMREAEATVIGIDGDGVILDRTVFYPEGGGQPGDRGMLGRFIISDTLKGEDGSPRHIIKGEKPAVGETLPLVLDWEHRYLYMMEHSAQHLVSSILFRHGIGTVAVHQGERFFTIETDSASIDDALLLSVEDEALRAVSEGHAIEQREMSHEEAEALGMRRSIKVEGRVKVVFISGLDAVACGGVHLKSTSEIGELSYYGQERIRGHVRTMWKCGPLAVSSRRENLAIVRASSALLSSEIDGIVEAIGHLAEENAELRHMVKKARRASASFEYSLHRRETEEGKAVIFHTSEEISSFEDAISETDSQEALIVDDSARFMFHGTGERFSMLREGLKAYSLRGGGRGMLYRGSLSGDISRMLKEAGELLNG